MISVPYEVKKALRDGMLRKNYRFLVLNDDGTTDFTIDNDTLVSESVSIDERMCSGDTLKFGLCEGSSLEFQYFNHPNIYERRIQAFVDVQYLAGVVGRINASGSFTVPVNGSYTFEVKKGSATGLYITFAGGGDIYVDFVLGQTTDTEELEAGDVVTLYNPSSDALFEVSADMWDTIPMGFFDVKKCSRQASTGIMKVTAYNKLMSEYLDAKANSLIAEIQPDGMDNDTITIQTIQDNLLTDYAIKPKDAVTIIPQLSQSSAYQTDTSFRVQENGSSTNYYITIVHTIESISFSGTVPHRLHVIKDKYQAKLKTAIDGIKSAIYSELKNPATAWASLQNSAYFAQIFPKATFVSGGYIVGELMYYLEEISAPSFQAKRRILEKLNYISAVSPVYFSGITFGYPTQIILSRGISEEYRTIWTASDSLVDGDIVVEVLKTDSIEEIAIDVNNLPDVTLRELTGANYELHCQFGQLSRVTDLFEGVELNNGGLYPAEDLYPANDLYPSGASLSATKAMYSQLWADEGNRRKWRYLIITYKGLNGDNQEEDFTLQRTVNADGTDDYNMSDNWLFRNMVWTAQQIGDYADAMVLKMRSLTWFPFEMWCAGLPYLETGDQIEIPLNGEVYKSYILQRQLKGIQNLQDTYINGTLDIF